MMFKHFILLSFFSIYLCSTEIKIASYNVENLFDMVYDGSEYKDYIPYTHEWTSKNFQKKLLNISEVICDINADIIGLQEIENKNVLKKLQKSLKRIGCTYKYSAITSKNKSAIQVAILSRFPIKYFKEIVVKKSFRYRNILEVKYVIDGYSFFVYVNHWSSKRAKESKRIISAKALIKRLKLLKENSEYILLGDFNSDYDEYLHLENKYNDSQNKTGINHVLHTVKANNLFVRNTNFTKNSFEHYNLWLEQPNYKRWSHNFYGKKQALDAMILPKSLFNGKGLDYINHSFSILKKPYLFHDKGYIFRWVYKKKKHKGVGYSDHLPIVASFSTTKYFREKKIIENEQLIDQLYNKDVLFPVILKKIKVIVKEKNKITISQEKSKKNIFLYGSKNYFDLNGFYDLKVYNRKIYKGHYEIIDFEIEKRYDSK